MVKVIQAAAFKQKRLSAASLGQSLGESSNGLQRGVHRLSQLLLSRSVRAAIVTVGAACLAHRFFNWDQHSSWSVLVIDVEEKHQQQVAYVLNNALLPELGIEVQVALDAGLQQDQFDLCRTTNQLNQIASQVNKPLVINFSIGSAGIDLMQIYLQRATHQLERQYGRDRTAWSDEVTTQYQQFIKRAAEFSYSQIINQLYSQCDSGDIAQHSFYQALNQLVQQGVNVVFAVGNGGKLLSDLRQLDYIPKKMVEDLTRSVFFSEPESLPAGVLVVGGAIQTMVGAYGANPFSMPSWAVDLVALDQQVQVDAAGALESGTSFAAPKVSALLANLRVLNPSLSPGDAEQLIKQTAQTIDNVPVSKVGAGVMQVDRAMQRAHLNE